MYLSLSLSLYLYLSLYLLKKCERVAVKGCIGWGRSSSSTTSPYPTLPPPVSTPYLWKASGYVFGEGGDAHLLHPQPGWILVSSSCSTTSLTTLSIHLLRWLRGRRPLQWLWKVCCSLPRTPWMWLLWWRGLGHNISLCSLLLRKEFRGSILQVERPFVTRSFSDSKPSLPVTSFFL